MTRATAALAALLLAACAEGSPILYKLPEDEAEQYPTAYIAEVVANPDGDDLAEGAGEHVVIASNFDHRTDMGGWAVEDAHGNRLPLGIGRQVDPGETLRVHPTCGENSEVAVFACLDEEILDDGGDVVRLLDSGGSEVAQFAYGDAADG